MLDLTFLLAFNLLMHPTNVPEKIFLITYFTHLTACYKTLLQSFPFNQPGLSQHSWLALHGNKFT